MHRRAQPGVELSEEPTEEGTISSGHGLHSVGHDHPRRALTDIRQSEHNEG